MRLEPLAPRHADDLWEASRDPRVWRWLPVVQPQDARRVAGAGWARLSSAPRPALELAFATILRRRATAVGSTRYLALRPEHRALEIGWTWLTPSAGDGRQHRGEAAAAGARLRGARLPAGRVQDRRAERARPAAPCAALPAQFEEGIHRKHMLVRGGENRDCAWFSVIDDDWPARP